MRGDGQPEIKGVLPERWYGIEEASRVRARPRSLTRFGKKLVLFRTASGALGCFEDRCPHRAVELSGGWVEGESLACPFHAFRFAADGRCVEMPCEGSRARIPGTMRARALPAREAHGLVWVYLGAPRPAEELPELPWIEAAPRRPAYSSSESFVWPVPFARAEEAFFDVHHVPVLHGVGGLARSRRVDPLVWKADGDSIELFACFREDDGPPRDPASVERWTVAVRWLAPAMTYLVINEALRLLVVDAPIDAGSTWRFVRYHNDVVRVPLLGHLVAWAMRFIDVRTTQRAQDLPVVRTQIDDHPDVLIRCDAAIAAYRKLLRKQQSWIREGSRPPSPPGVERSGTG